MGANYFCLDCVLGKYPEGTWVREENWRRSQGTFLGVSCGLAVDVFVDGGVFQSGSSAPAMLSLKALVLCFPWPHLPRDQKHDFS